jgi:hypothetical protein
MPRHLPKGVPSLVRTFLVLLLVPLAGWAQERVVVFNQVTVSSQEASIDLEFADGTTLSTSFRDGRVLVNGDEVGAYSIGDALDRSWRSLLGQAVAADNGQVAELLRNWTPPGGLSGEGARSAEALAARIDATFTLSDAATQPALPALSPEAERELLQAMVLRPERLQALTRALEDRRAGLPIQVHIGESVRVETDDDVEGTLLIVDGDLLVEGRVRGDILLLGGEIELGDDARVDGDLRWIDARVLGDRGAVRGDILEVTGIVTQTEAQLRAELERTLRDSLRDVVRAEMEPRASVRTGRDTSRSVFRNIVRGLGGLFQTALTFLLLVGLGLAILYFFPRHFETVARTAHNATGRSALVGLAGLVLAFPTWILGIVVLAITIIGIPVMLLWLPVFPLAFAMAMVLGYLAMAWNLGRWVSRRQFQGLEGFETSRPAAQIGTGVAVLLVAFALAHLFRMGGPVLGIFHGLLTFVGVVLSMVAIVVGLGAVILSRAGRDRHYAGGGWSPDDDPFGPEPDPFGPRGTPFSSRSPEHNPFRSRPEAPSAEDESSSDAPPSSSEMRWETEGGAPEGVGLDPESPHER